MDKTNNFSHDKIMPMVYPKSQKLLSNFFSDSGELKEVSESKRWQGE
jgi:ribosomal protein S18